MADLLTRPLSVKFSTNNLRGISHNDVLAGLEKTLNRNEIKSIQIKQKECIITLTSTEVKNKLILGTTNIKNRLISIHDVENLITSVTVKDSPYEMPDSMITAHMSKYGDIVSGSVARGKIKGTNIDNGSRYLKIINCVSVLPLKDDIGQFTIRIFADNNRTPCRHCGDTSHPYFRCNNITEKPDTQNIRNCHGNHQRRECPRDVLCRFCGEEGHVQMKCPRELYGNYMADIIEGRDSLISENSDSSSEDGSYTSKRPNSNAGGDVCTSAGHTGSINRGNRGWERPSTGNQNILPENSLPENSQRAEPGETGSQCSYTDLLTLPKLVIGDSNTCRLNIKDGNVLNLSKSGSKLDEIEGILNSSQAPSNVYSVAVHLGTNDLKHDKRDTVVKNAIDALVSVKGRWPKASVGFSSIIPRLGKSSPIKRFNENAKFVNNAVLQHCISTRRYHYVDNDEIFQQNGKSLYDAKDPSGIHVNNVGAERLYDNLAAFLVDDMSDELDLATPRSKRLRSQDSHSSPSNDRLTKQGKLDSSLNVNGIRNKIKREKIFHYLKQKSYDIVYLQETHCANESEASLWAKSWEGNIIWNNGSSQSRGVAILIKKNIDLHIVENSIYNDEHGRIISLRATLSEGSCYQLTNHSLGNKCNHIIGGDFNCTFDNSLDRKGAATVDVKADEGCQELKALCNKLNLEDVWRRRNQGTKCFTFIRNNAKSRIDFFLSSKSIDDEIEQCKIVPCIFTDHNTIEIKINTENVARRRDYGCSIQEYASLIKTFWSSWTHNKTSYASCSEWWEMSKIKIRAITLEYSQSKSRSKTNIKKLEQKLSELLSEDLTLEIIEKISNIKQLIADYYDSKLEAHKLRSKANLIQHNEKSSDFFFSLEKQRGKNKLWHHIKTDSGATKYGIVSILEEQTKYYKKLLNSEGTDS
ncbi:YTX2-like protein, partial [Mya arenaria]